MRDETDSSGTEETGDECVVTVVTVVRNDPAGLEKTARSVIAQEGISFEYIVRDGASTDDTLEVARRFGSSIDRIISEPDNGVYDAMNRCVALARGRFILFLNAGDRFVEPGSLKGFLESVPENTDFIIGHHIGIDDNGHRQERKAAPFSRTFSRLVAGDLDRQWLLDIPCHQATATRTKLLKQCPYDTRLTIAADHDRLFRGAADGANIVLKDMFVAEYRYGGLSGRRKWSAVCQRIETELRYTKAPVAVLRFNARLLAASVFRAVFRRRRRFSPPVKNTRRDENRD
ncbi:MAG: glycosyltransferase [Methylobacteriaceae bacterium]|nr:glycosyltransferase [Methylobacteriaceae bacterium]